MIFDRCSSLINATLNALKRKINKSEETEFLPAVLEVTETPPSPVGRAVLWTLFVILSVGILWAFLGTVDEVAVAPGKLIPTGNTKTIQSEDKGVIKQIYVKDGDRVKVGQPLVQLDQTYTEADLKRIRAQAAQLELEIERLLAEQAGAIFSPQIRDGITLKDIEYQVQSFNSRMNDYRTRLAATQSAVIQNEANLAISRITLRKNQELYAIAKDKEERIQQLLDNNAIAYFALLDQRSRRLELEQTVAAQLSDIDRIEALIKQSKLNAEAISTAFYSEIGAKVVENKKQLTLVTEELRKAERKQALATISAPIAGRVNQLAIHTVGGVVTEAQPLMMIVPDDASLVMEAWIANKDIGFVKEGQAAAVKVETFNFQKYGTIEAVLSEISPEAVEDKEKGRVYRALLKLRNNKMLVQDQFASLEAGMSATADIKIKEKRIVEYFLDPFRKYQDEALRER